MDISNKASDADYIREVEKTINNVHMSVTETLDEFIFQTIDEFIRSNFYTVVSKEELAQAIRLIQMTRQYGQDISEKLITALLKKTALYFVADILKDMKQALKRDMR